MGIEMRGWDLLVQLNAGRCHWWDVNNEVLGWLGVDGGDAIQRKLHYLTVNAIYYIIYEETVVLILYSLWLLTF